MTINQTNPAGANPFSGLVEAARDILGFIAKLALAGLLVVVAGILAVLTAFAGLAIAGIALLMRFIGRAPVRRPRARTKWDEPGQVTLEARQTQHGWTVE